MYIITGYTGNITTIKIRRQMATAAGSLRRYNRFFMQWGIRTVLDYGAGTLRNARFLAEQGFSVYAADIPEQVERILRMSASATLSGVLDVGDLECGFSKRISSSPPTLQHCSVRTTPVIILLMAYQKDRHNN
jgi:hypothetical protein